MIATATPEAEYIEPGRIYSIAAVKVICGATSKPAWTRVRGLKLEDGSQVSDHVINMGRKKFLRGSVVIDAMTAHANRQRRRQTSQVSA